MKTRKPRRIAAIPADLTTPHRPSLLNAWINGKACIELASVRRAAPPFTHQSTGNLVALDFRTFDGGGMSNVRLTREVAIALRDCLHAYFQRGPLEMRIGRCADDTLTLEEKAQ